MEENDEEIKEEAEQTAEELLEGKSPLEKAEYYIAWKRLDEAQSILDSVPEKSGRKYYIQSRLYKERKWYNEQRKQLKKAVKADPDNEDYKKELAELENSDEMKQYKRGMKALHKNQMGDTGNMCAEACGEICCYGLCAGICEGIGSGC